MKSRAIVWLWATIVAVVGGAACSLDNVANCGNRGAPPDGEGGAGGEGGGIGGWKPNGIGGFCDGCYVGATCEPGYDLKACGSKGTVCAPCAFGETCTTRACAAGESICIQMLEAEGLGADCADDAACVTDEWCAVSCCDPVTHVCFAVGKCVPKRAAGEHCDHVDGDHQCSSGVCDTELDECS